MDQSFPPLPTCFIPHPFRLGVPSYVYPADILPNVETLAPYVDDIELVLFESSGVNDQEMSCSSQNDECVGGAPLRADHDHRRPGVGSYTQPKPNRPHGDMESDINVSNIPTPDIIQRLAELAQQHSLTYTVHFPIDRQLGSPDAEERRALLHQMLAIIDRTQPLAPFAYILHLEGVTRDSDHARVQAWQNDIAALLPALIERAGDPKLLCVENLNYPFAWCEPILDRFGLGVCIDLGHLWVGGDNVKAHLKRHLPRTRIIHLHGVRDVRDHLALTALAPGRLREALNSIDKFTGVLTLEIFNYEAMRDSVVCLNQLQN